MPQEQDNIDDELLECFDDNGNSIESQSRSILHAKPYRVWHGVADIWLVNPEGEILCTKRSDEVSGNPGKWQTYVGGHVKAGTSFEQTAMRELEEEVGLKVAPSGLYLVESGKRPDYMHMYHKYMYIVREPIGHLTFTDREITEAAWWNFEAYSNDRAINPDKWCNNISLEYYNMIKEVLNNNNFH